MAVTSSWESTSLRSDETSSQIMEKKTAESLRLVIFFTISVLVVWMSHDSSPDRWALLEQTSRSGRLNAQQALSCLRTWRRSHAAWERHTLTQVWEWRATPRIQTRSALTDRRADHIHRHKTTTTLSDEALCSTSSRLHTHKMRL